MLLFGVKLRYKIGERNRMVRPRNKGEDDEHSSNSMA